MPSHLDFLQAPCSPHCRLQSLTARQPNCVGERRRGRLCLIFKRSYRFVVDIVARGTAYSSFAFIFCYALALILFSAAGCIQGPFHPFASIFNIKFADDVLLLHHLNAYSQVQVMRRDPFRTMQTPFPPSLTNLRNSGAVCSL